MILSDIEKQIKEKIEQIGVPLKNWEIQINYGIKTGLNDAFIIDNIKRQELIKQDPKSVEIIRPILRGRDIKRYGYEFANLWLINAHNGIREKGIKPINIKDYAAIQKHLDHFYSALEKRADKGDSLYNLRNCAYMDDFSKQKIVWAETMRIHKGDLQNFPRFGYENDGRYVTDKTCFFATGSHLKHIIGVLNSELGRYLCSKYVSILDDGGYLMQKIYIERIPIVPFSAKLEDIVSNLKTDDYSDTINKLVYELYELNKDEIAFIKASQKQPLRR